MKIGLGIWFKWILNTDYIHIVGAAEIEKHVSKAKASVFRWKLQFCNVICYYWKFSFTNVSRVKSLKSNLFLQVVIKIQTPQNFLRRAGTVLACCCWSTFDIAFRQISSLLVLSSLQLVIQPPQVSASRNFIAYVMILWQGVRSLYHVSIF